VQSQFTVEFGVTRVITQIVMHVLMQREFEQALLMMKYAANHPWKFRNVPLAFFSGFLQIVISCIVETSNIYIMLANGSTQFDIIANFIIMLIVADFDNYFYAVRSRDKISEYIVRDEYANLFVWETTTSRDAHARIPENELAKENILSLKEMHLRPKYIAITWRDRSCSNRILFFIYRTLQVGYTSFYYYFMPFVATFSVWLLLLEANQSVAEKKFADSKVSPAK